MIFGETLRLSSFPRCHELLTQRLRHSAELKSTHTQFVDDTHAAEVALFLSIAPFGVCLCLDTVLPEGLLFPNKNLWLNITQQF